MNERIKKSVTPSGVAFSVRNLKGKDQRILSSQDSDDNAGRFNEMLCGALQSLGSKGKHELNTNDVERLLTNDRKFMLVVLRQHTLNYQKEFEFVYEWPLRASSKDREKKEYSINFTHENFPVKPYAWVRNKIEELRTKQESEKETVLTYDGHIVDFPQLYDSYEEMLATNKLFKGKLPVSGSEFEFELLDGIIESAWAKVERKSYHANTPIIMRRTKQAFIKGTAERKSVNVSFDTDEADLMDVEHVRTCIREVEGMVDTMLAIQHPEDASREARVDLVALPAFFFPSLAM